MVCLHEKSLNVTIQQMMILFSTQTEMISVSTQVEVFISHKKSSSRAESLTRVEFQLAYIELSI